MNAQCADGIPDRIAEERILVLRRFDGLAFRWIDSGENQRTMQRERERRGEEERHRKHMRWIIVEMQVLVSGVRYPVEMADDAIGKAEAPSTQQQRANHDERDVSEDRHTESERHMQANAQLAADLHFAECPGHERADRAYRNELPQAAFAQRRESQSVADVRRRDADAP